MPTVSIEGITGRWNLNDLTEDGVYTYTFTPNSGQNATSTTLTFSMFSSTTSTVQAHDDQFVFGTTTPGVLDYNAQTPSIFTNDKIDGSGFSFNYVTATISQKTWGRYLLAMFPSQSSLITLNTDGTLSIGAGLRVGDYRITYCIAKAGCPNAYSMATAFISIVGPPVQIWSKKKITDEEQSVTGDVTVYPNPSTGVYTVDLTNVSEKYNTVKVFDVLGKTVYEGNLTPGTLNTLNLSYAQEGYYFAKISNTTSSKTVKLIKQ